MRLSSFEPSAYPDGCISSHARRSSSSRRVVRRRVLGSEQRGERDREACGEPIEIALRVSRLVPLRGTLEFESIDEVRIVDANELGRVLTGRHAEHGLTAVNHLVALGEVVAND